MAELISHNKMLTHTIHEANLSVNGDIENLGE